MFKFPNLKILYNHYIVTSCFIISIYFFYLLVKFCNSGLDITDEGYYLNWISNPYDYKSSVSQFGFIYHLIFIAFSENITILRIINLFSNFIISYCLIYFLINSFIKSNEKFFYQQTLIIGLSLLVFLSIKIFTPNYNSLALKGLLITCLGILILENSVKKIGFFLIGLGGWMVFMGKPSSAFILAIIILIYLISRKKSFYPILFCFMTSSILLFFTSIMIDGSPILFFERILMDMNHYKLFGAGYTVKDLSKSIITITAKPELQNTYAIYLTLISMILIFLFLTILLNLNLKNYQHNYLFRIIFFSIILITLVYLIFFNLEWLSVFERYQKLQIFSILIFSIYCVLKFFNFNLVKTLRTLNLRLILLFLICPYIYAFGSNVNLLKKSLEAGIFYLLASIVILSPLFNKKKNYYDLFIILFTGLLVTSIHISLIIEYPYRQSNSLKLNNSTFIINSNRLKLNDERVQYISAAREIANKAGMVKGDYILDLTGKSPGLIYLLNAKSLGSPWMSGGNPGSFEYASAKLNLENCKKISKSWILFDQDSRKISTDLTNIYGSIFILDYIEVGSWQAIESRGIWKQKLFKPKNPNKINKNCILKREAKTN